MKQRYIKPPELKQAEKEIFDWKKLQHPRVPEGSLVFPKLRDDSTNELTKSVSQYTRCKGFFIERINSTGRMLNGKWIKGTGTKGTADLSAVINGKAVKIEIKCATTKDRQSEAQKHYQQKVEKAGAVYLIVRNFSEFYHWLNDFIKNNAE